MFSIHFQLYDRSRLILQEVDGPKRNQEVAEEEYGRAATEYEGAVKEQMDETGLSA